MIISAVEVPGYDRFSPHQDAGQAGAISRIGQSGQVENGGSAQVNRHL